MAEPIEAAFYGILDKAKKDGRLALDGMVRTMEPIFRAAGFRQADMPGIKHILVLRLDEIGDSVLTSGFLRELRASEPRAYITLVVNPVVYPLVELCPYVNEVLVYKGSHKGSFAERFEWALELCREHLWARHFALCLCPRWDFDRYFALLLGYMSGSAERVGYSEKLYEGKARANAGFDLLLTRPVMNPPQIVHEVERNFFLLQAAGYPVRDKRLELWYDAADVQRAAVLCKRFSKKRQLVSVALGANEANKAYPAEKFLTALRILAEQGLAFALLGGPGDRAAGNQIAAGLDAGVAVNFAGETSLRESAAIMARTMLYIGSDTGLKHVAAALSLPVLEINREAKDCQKTIISLWTRFFPWQTPTISLQPEHALGECARVLSQGGCVAREPHCIAQIGPEEIVAGYEALTRMTFLR